MDFLVQNHGGDSCFWRSAKASPNYHKMLIGYEHFLGCLKTLMRCLINANFCGKSTFSIYQLFARRELWLSLQFWESLDDKCTQQADVGVRLLV
jgi:hypothetical protein